MDEVRSRLLVCLQAVGHDLTCMGLCQRSLQSFHVEIPTVRRCAWLLPPRVGQRTGADNVEPERPNQVRDGLFGLRHVSGYERQIRRASPTGTPRVARLPATMLLNALTTGLPSLKLGARGCLVSDGVTVTGRRSPGKPRGSGQYVGLWRHRPVAPPGRARGNDQLSGGEERTRVV
jgi:hypothetical protein